MSGLGRCPCDMRGFNAVSGLGQIVMQPLGDGDMNAAGEVGRSMARQLGMFAPAAVMGAAGAYGAVIGGLSSGKLKGAGTGTLLASGLTGVLGAIGLAAATRASLTDPTATPIDPTSTQRTGYGMAAAYGLVGLGLLGWGAARSYRAIKRR